LTIGDKAFARCASLTRISFGGHLRYIGHYAFYGCTSLSSVNIPDSLSEMGTAAFQGVRFLDEGENVLPHTLESLRGFSYEGHDSVLKRIGSKFVSDGLVFKLDRIDDTDATLIGYSEPMAHMSVPVTVSYGGKDYPVSEIAPRAFALFNELVSVDTGDSVSSIGASAFYGCKSLDSVTMPGSVTSIGGYAFSDCSSLTSVTMLGSVTSIEDSAFSYCSSLASVTMLGSVTSIGASAFYGCKSLSSVSIPDSVTSIGASAFSGCSSLTSATIPDSVTTIENGVFSNTCLSSVSIPDSVTSIGNYAFSGCSFLSLVFIPDSVTAISEFAFKGITFLDEDGCVLPYTPESLRGSAYEGHDGVLKRTAIEFVSDGLKFKLNRAIDADATLVGFTESMAHLSVPEAVSYGGKIYAVSAIGPKAFYGLSELVSANLGSVSEIGMKAFARCTALETVAFGGSLETIGEYAFYGCSSLASADIGGYVKNIYKCAFSDCTSLTRAVIPKSVGYIGENAFSGISFQDENGDALKETASSLRGFAYEGYGSVLKRVAAVCGPSLTWKLDDNGNLTIAGDGAMYDGYSSPWGTKIKSVRFEGLITSIGNYAFCSCTSLTSVSIPDSVVSIGDSAFSGCASLSSVSVPGSVTSIGDSAFYGCSSLASVSIPDSVASIGDYAFCNCTSLPSIYIPDSVTSIGELAFYGCSSLSFVFIPDSLTSIEDLAFAGFKFLDESGKILPHIPASLGGFAYEGHDKVLKRAGLAFVSDGLVFKLNRAIDADATLVGFTEPVAHLSVPATVSYEGKSYAVSAIGPKAFYGLIGLASADLGSVSKIGMKAFSRCGSLETVAFGESLKTIGEYAFYGCGSLASVSIPDSATSIGKSAFSGCKALTSVVIPGSVASIGENVFHGIRFLDERGNVLDGSAASLSGYAYEGSCCVLQRVVDGFTFVSGGLVFKLDWSGDADATLVGFSEPVAHLAVPGSVSYGGKDYPVVDIGPKAFYGLDGLVSADLGGVTQIGMKAFARCSSLESVDFGDSLTEIGPYAFYGCDSLVSAIIPDSVVSIGKCAFSGCISLASVAVGSSVETIGDQAFFGIRFFDEGGKLLPRTAESLAGYLYVGDGDGRLYRSVA
jgi:hypothetical protein